MKRDFNELMLSLKKSITPADFFVDFPKVYVNIKEYELHLNILNTLIGKENIEEEFADLIRQYPEVMRSIPILLATHEHKFNIINAPTVDMLKSIKDKNFKFLEEKFICYDFEAIDHPIEDYAEFLKSSGLFDLISNRNIKNLIRNIGVAWKVLRKEKPDVIISSGAAVAVPFFYLGKLFGKKLIYIEVFDRIDKPTMTGKMVYPIVDKFIVQWEEMLKIYPKAVYGGAIY